MKKYILLPACLVYFVIALAACSNNGPGNTAAESKDTAMKATAAVYTCKMHPEVISDKPGKCPKCGMDLIKKEDLKKDSTLPGKQTDSTKH